ncbi:response regulator transcription factor [Sutcliffiella sp. NPDC057660]|uniref:response regulator transcription factor n=1 Tax=Sutcliffiella sp. NPDC057660 TaxID=3346199 RepID=UPI003674463F
MEKVLVVEDEVPINQVLKVYLQKEGYQVVQAFDGNEAIRLFQQELPALVLLDIMLPETNGWKILEEIRMIGSCPVIMLTALDEITYRLNGLKGGADDYITKPFIADEVVARVQAVLRRSGNKTKPDGVKRFGQLTVNWKSHSVSLYGVTIPLSPRDLALFLFLSQHPNQTFTREQLLDRVWGMDYDGSDRAVDLAVKRIRKALGEWSIHEGEIKTLRGLGYQFCVKD